MSREYRRALEEEDLLKYEILVKTSGVRIYSGRAKSPEDALEILANNKKYFYELDIKNEIVEIVEIKERK